MSSISHPKARLAGAALAASAVLGALALPGTAAAAVAATRPVKPAPPLARAAAVTPPVPAGLPEGIEDLAVYVRQNSCDPTPKPGTLALGRMLSSTYTGTGYVISHDCGSEPVSSEHQDGRALDWLVSVRSATQKAQAQAFLAWLFAPDDEGRAFAMARRLGVMYIIWNDQIWGAWDPLDGWAPYSTCATHPDPADDQVCNRDRMHISLSWEGAMSRASFWSRAVATPDYGPCRPADLNWAPPYTGVNTRPCPVHPAATAPKGASDTLLDLVKYSGATVSPGDSGPVVAAVQRGLDVTADGDYGPFTADAVAAFQRQHGLAPSGAMDAATWRWLISVHEARIPVSITPNPSPLTKYVTVVLRYGDRGPAVTALQKALKVTASGWFGPKTRTAVVAFQVRAKLKPTGVVDAAMWRALGA